MDIRHAEKNHSSLPVTCFLVTKEESHQRKGPGLCTRPLPIAETADGTGGRWPRRHDLRKQLGLMFGDALYSSLHALLFSSLADYNKGAPLGIPETPHPGLQHPTRSSLSHPYPLTVSTQKPISQCHSDACHLDCPLQTCTVSCC